MAETKIVSKYAKAKKIFGVVFVVSGLASVLLFVFSFLSMSSTPLPSSKISPDQDTASNSNRMSTTSANTAIPQPSEVPKLSRTPTPTGSDSLAGNKASGNSKSSNDNTTIAQIQRQSTPPPPLPTRSPTYSTTATPAAFNTPQSSGPTRSVSPAAAFFAATLVLSVFLTVVSLLGFLIVATVAWRRERQAKESLNIEKHRQAMEVERLKYELEKSRQQAAAAATGAAANTSQVMLCPTCKKTCADGSLRFCVDDGATLSFSFNAVKTESNILNKTLRLDDDSSAETLDARKIIDKYR